MQSVVQELEQKTLTYWRLSSQFNLRAFYGITAMDGLKDCNDIVYGTSPQRPIRHSMYRLRGEIIVGTTIQPDQILKSKVIHAKFNRG